MANNILANELDRIADLYEESGYLEQRYDALPSEAGQERQEFVHQTVENLHAYQTKRETEMKGLVLDLKWLREHPIPQRPAFPKMEAYKVSSTPKSDEKTGQTQGGEIKNAKEVMSYLSGRTSAVGCFVCVASVVAAYVLDTMFMVPYKVTILVILALWLLIRPLFRNFSYEDFKVYLEILDRNKKKMEDWKAEVECWIEEKKKWTEELEKFGCETLVSEVCTAVEAYDKEFYKMVADCDTAFSKAIEKFTIASREIQEKYLQKGEEILKEINANKNQLNAVTLLHPDMFSRAAKFAEAIRMGRADTVKEAINIVLDDERRAEEEAQRRREAAARQAALEQQAEDNRRHNEEMERTAAAQAAEARRHNDEMARAAQNQAQMQERERQERVRMAQKRCQNCAVRGCPVSYKTQSTGAVCPSFVPRKR